MEQVEFRAYYEPHLLNMANARPAIEANNGDTTELDTAFSSCMDDLDTSRGEETEYTPSVSYEDIPFYCTACGKKLVDFIVHNEEGFYAYAPCPRCDRGELINASSALGRHLRLRTVNGG